jgi:D-arginine dehydrogenase
MLPADAFVAEFSALGVRVDPLDRAALEERLPGLKNEWQLGAWEPDCCDIDVAGLHQHWLAQARRLGAELLCRAPLTAARRAADGWAHANWPRRVGRARADQRRRSLGRSSCGWRGSPRSASAAAPHGGAIADRAAGASRSAAGAGASTVRSISSRRAGLWLSPHDETPSPPCDAAPEELDVALAIDRFEAVVDWRIERVEHRWAGCAAFAPDRLPVYGFDPPGKRDFFWFAGQGGFGIQTAPAAADLALRLMLGKAAARSIPRPTAREIFLANRLFRVILRQFSPARRNRWRTVSKSGRTRPGNSSPISATTAETIFWTEGYSSKASAKNAIESIKKNGPGAETVDT